MIIKSNCFSIRSIILLYDDIDEDVTFPSSRSSSYVHSQYVLQNSEFCETNLLQILFGPFN